MEMNPREVWIKLLASQAGRALILAAATVSAANTAHAQYMGSNAMCVNASGQTVPCGSNNPANPNPISAALLGAGGASTPATSSLLKGTGTANGVTAATAGTDYVTPAQATAAAPVQTVAGVSPASGNVTLNSFNLFDAYTVKHVTTFANLPTNVAAYLHTVNGTTIGDYLDVIDCNSNVQCTAGGGRYTNTLQANADGTWHFVLNVPNNFLRLETYYIPGTDTFCSAFNKMNTALQALGGGHEDTEGFPGTYTCAASDPTVQMGDPAGVNATQITMASGSKVILAQTNGTTWGVTINNRTFLDGRCSVAGGCGTGFLAGSSTINANLAGVVHTPTTAPYASYFRIAGMSFASPWANVTLTSGITADFQYAADEAVVRDSYFKNVAGIVGHVDHSCCNGVSFFNDHFYGSNGTINDTNTNGYASSSSPVFVFDSHNGDSPFMMQGTTLNSPGIGANTLQVLTGNLLTESLYEETNCYADTTSAVNYVGPSGSATFIGGMIFGACNAANTTTKYAFENHGILGVHGVQQGGNNSAHAYPTSWINDAVSGRTLVGGQASGVTSTPADYTWYGTGPGSTTYMGPLSAWQGSTFTFASGSQSASVLTTSIPYNNLATGDVSHCNALLTVAVTGTYDCLYGYLTTNSSTNHTGTLAPIWGQVDHNGTGTITTAYGVSGKVGNLNTGGTITNGYAVEAQSPDNASGAIRGTITKPVGFHADSQFGGYDYYAEGATDKMYHPGPIISTLTTPTSSSAACTAGQIAWDAGYVYVCTATNTWKRAALTTF